MLTVNTKSILLSKKVKGDKKKSILLSKKVNMRSHEKKD